MCVARPYSMSSPRDWVPNVLAASTSERISVCKWAPSHSEAAGEGVVDVRWRSLSRCRADAGKVRAPFCHRPVGGYSARERLPRSLFVCFVFLPSVRSLAVRAHLIGRNCIRKSFFPLTWERGNITTCYKRTQTHSTGSRAPSHTDSDASLNVRFVC